MKEMWMDGWNGRKEWKLESYLFMPNDVGGDDVDLLTDTYRLKKYIQPQRHMQGGILCSQSA